MVGEDAASPGSTAGPLRQLIGGQRFPRRRERLQVLVQNLRARRPVVAEEMMDGGGQQEPLLHRVAPERARRLALLLHHGSPYLAADQVTGWLVAPAESATRRAVRSSR